MNAVPPKVVSFAALLTGTPFARALETRAQVLIIEARPNEARAGRLVFASPSARAAFGAQSLERLDGIIIGGDGPGARRMRELFGLLKPGAPPRLERLRFYAGPVATIATFICAALIGPNAAKYLVASSTDFSTPASAPAESPLPEAGVSAIEQAPPRITARRFVWRLDENLAFVEVPDALTEFFADNAPRISETIDALCERVGLDPDGALAGAFARRATFSAIALDWPRAGGGRLAVNVSGTPVFDRHRVFRGFRGFGVIADHDNAAAPPADAARAVLAEPPEAASPAEPAPAAPLDVVAKPPLENIEAPEPIVPDDAVEEPRPAEPEDAPAPRGADVIALRPYDADNVVPIRPGAARAAQGEARRPETVELTTNERNAFREIARALGARVRDDDRDRSDADDDALAEPATRGAPVESTLAQNAAALLDRLPIGVLVTRDDKALHVNRTLLDLLGYDDIDHFIAASGLSEIFQGRLPDNVALPETGGAVALTAADGETIDVEALRQTFPWDDSPATLTSFRRASGPETIEKIRGLEIDANARQAQTSELSAILDTAADGVVIFDNEGSIISLNRSGEALFGFDQKELAGESFLTLLAPESRPAGKAFLERLKTDSASSLIHDGMEASGRERNGGEIPLFISFGRVGPAGDRFCAVLRDATQWKTTERELQDARALAERASAQKSDFLARISHEIRTPLNAILGFAEVIVEERFGPIGNERYKDYLKDIHASGAHVLSLVNDLLDLSKIEAGKLELAFQPIDANQLIQECVSLMQPQAARERIIMRLSLFEKLPKVIADERSLRQIMLNLMSNAVKFNEPGGQVIVSTALNEQSQAVLRVRDTGIGMSEDEIATAMQPFRQIPTARPRTGSGLGLPLTKALVEANRAGFSIRSGKQQGTLVELAFPTVQVAAQ